MSTFYLDIVLLELSQLWQEQPGDATFFSKVCALTRYYRHYRKAKALSFWEDKMEARRLMEETNA